MKGRTQQIRDYICRQGDVTVKELCGMFPDRSPMTIRRDLAELEAARLIIRTHGGAKPFCSMSLEPYYTDREGLNAGGKAIIAAKAAALLENARCVFLDAGTTAMALARVLPGGGLTVVTSAPNVALEIVSRHPELNVILTGGGLNPKTLCCSGSAGIEQLLGLNMDTAVLSASGFSAKAGFTVGDYGECEFKRTVISRAERVIVLADRDKIGLNMPYTFARARDIDVFVTDAPPAAHIRAYLENGGAECI